MTFSAFLLSLLLLPAAAFAQPQGTLTPEVWSVDTEVTIRGQELQGPMPSKSKVCFAPESDKESLLCFLSSHPNITAWGSSTITFIPPKNTPPVGVVILVHPSMETQCMYLYGEQTCQTVTTKTKVEVGTYKATPHIARIVDVSTRQPLRRLDVGRTYEITGYRFGDTGYGIYVGRRRLNATDILVWTHETIRFRVSEPPEDPVSVQVHNGAGKSNAWLLEQFQPVSATGSAAPGTGSALGSGTGDAIDDASADEEDVEDADAPAVDEKPFIDVDADDPYAGAVRWAKASGLLAGYPDGTFRPLRAITRAELLKVLFAHEDGARMNVAPPSGFTDVHPGSWYTPYVRFAAARNIVRGYPDGTFRPSQGVNLAESLQMFYRSMAVPTLDPRGNLWYARYLEHATANGILFDRTADPSMPLTRRDAVWILWKLFQLQTGG